jgi:hypothetical protein
MENYQLIHFLQEQSELANFRANSYLRDSRNIKNPKRNIYVKLQKYIEDFLSRKSEIRWITMT